MAVGSIGPALGEGWAVARGFGALTSSLIKANVIYRTLFVGLAWLSQPPFIAWL